MARRVYFEIQGDATRRILFFSLVLLVFHAVAALAAAFLVAKIWAGPGVFLYLAPRFLFIALAAALFEAFLFPRGRMDALLRDLEARPLDTEDLYHRRLANILRELEIATPLGRIEAMVSPSPGRNALALSIGSRNVIVVSEGLISRLPRDGLAAVVAHAAARIVWGDALVGTILAGFSEPLRALAIPTLSDTADAILSLQGENRDLRADATAVAYLGDPFPLARAIDLAAEDPYLAEIPAGFRTMLFYDASRAQERLAVLSEIAGHPVSILLGRPSGTTPTVSAAATAERAPEREAVRSSPPRFRLYFAGAWLGPFSASETIHHNLFDWDGWVFREGDAAASPAAFLSELLAAANGKTPAPRDPLCPSCRGPLAPYNREGARILQCGGCGGMLLTRAVLLRELLRREEPPTPEAVAEAARIATRAESPVAIRRAPVSAGRLCPRCARAMLAGPFRGVYDALRVERCLGCDVVWFDAGELAVAEALVEARAPARSL